MLSGSSRHTCPFQLSCRLAPFVLVIENLYGVVLRTIIKLTISLWSLS